MSSGYEDRVLRYLKNYMEVARRAKEIIMEIDPEAEVYVFGSVVRGRYTAASDIDILVITRRIELKYLIMVEVYRRLEAPIELHVTTPEIFERWYRRFIAPEEMIKI
ncbi:MAG: nucleotidyltransferase domain-containing protein [Sulfolobales archaeon]